jgi:hypothetical protein
MNTFKNSGKTAGTAPNSDAEATTNHVACGTLTVNDEYSTKTIDSDMMSNDSNKILSESDVQLVDLFNDCSTAEPVIVHSQSNISSIILPSSIQPSNSQTTIIESCSHFDPFISPERSTDRLNMSLKTPYDKSSSNDDTIVASSYNDLSDIKSMIMDLSKTLLNKMTIIEQKIDENHQHTQRINHLLTDTVLPSLLDLSDIIQDTSAHLDVRIQSKLESIRKNIRCTQEQQPEVKDLMEI